MSSEDLGGLGGLENDKDLKELILSEQQNMQFQQQVKMRNKKFKKLFIAYVMWDTPRAD